MYARHIFVIMWRVYLKTWRNWSLKANVQNKMIGMAFPLGRFRLGMLRSYFYDAISSLRHVDYIFNKRAKEVIMLRHQNKLLSVFGYWHL
jgi:hypothetical protein